ncbi:MAG: GGDEF domain-containing protein [Bacilli bacterium]|nr:GGDEF domain-containing protein [Bacilli bacterium]
MSKKKAPKIVILSIVSGLVFIICLFLFINYSKDDKSLSILEKKWITNNTNNIVSVNVFNDIPVYGYNGSGVIFDFLDKFTEEYNVNFNKISYYSDDKMEYGDIAFKVLSPFTKLNDNDLLLYEDDYVVLAKENISINSIDEISGDTIGVLENDYDVVNKYINGKDNVSKYKSSNLLMESVKNDSVKYVIVPNMMFMNYILGNNLNIIYHVTDLDRKYVLSAKDSTVFNVFSKYYSKFSVGDFDKSYSRNYLNVFFDSAKITSLEQKNYNAKVYNYGYAVNMPYENYVDGKFVGVISNYLSDFETISNIEINAIKYSSIDEVKNALVSGEVDFALANFDYENLNMDKYTTLSFMVENYVVLSKSNININSIKGLKNMNVSVVGSSNLYNLCLASDINPTIYKDTDDLLRNINDESIVLIDKDTYLYYKDTKFDGYKIVFDDKIDSGYKFIINKNYLMVAKLFDYYISSNSYNNIRYKYNTNVSLNKGNINIIFVVLLVIFIICLFYFAYLISKKKEYINNVNKDDKSKYIDPMTSLKNRNYLNHNIYSWDDNVIFPQSIIVFDINRLREINDKLGREAGDEIVKRVASVLIDNQVENTDIIRSGGDEFLVYMVGYDEKYTLEYAKKLVKLMREIDHSFGVEYGYSMIYDEVKTIDDAINESIGMMSKNKNSDI